MGDVIDAAERFCTVRHAELYSLFLSEQMTQAELIGHMTRDEAFRLYVARRLIDAKARQRAANHDADDMA